MRRSSGRLTHCAVAGLLLGGLCVTGRPQPLGDEAAARALAQTLEETGQQWFQVVSDEPDNPDLAGFSAWLAARNDIADAEVQAGTLVATTTDGIMVRFSDVPAGVLGSGGPLVTGRPVIRSSSLGGPPALPLLGLALPGKPSFLGDMVPQGKALLLQCMPPGSHDPRPKLREILEYAGFSVVERRGKVADFLEMSSSSVVVVHSHGGTSNLKGAERYIVVADIVETTDVSSLRKYYQWLVDGELIAERKVVRDKVTKRPTKVVTSIDIVDTWFERRIPSMPNNAALIFITCHSADLDSPWRIFKSKGASAYLGFTGTIHSPWDCEIATRLLDRAMGANKFDPWETNPPRRPQGFEDAFDYIQERPQYRKDPKYGGSPKLSVWWEDDIFSAHPHIDLAQIAPLQDEDANYELDLCGGFGHESDCKVVCGGEPLDFRSVSGGGGWPLKVTLPRDVTGTLVVEDKYGRQSNPITISRFKATVDFEYDDMEVAGKVKLDYDCLAVGSRLYRKLDSDLIYAGLPEQIAQMPYVLVDVDADWKLEWDFDSSKTIGPVTIVARGDGTAEGRGPAEDDDWPDGTMGVWLTPAFGAVDERTCKAQVTAGATVGPINVTYNTPAGPQTKQRMVTVVALPASCDYDQQSGTLQPASGAFPFCRWKTSEGTLDPPPFDAATQAALPALPFRRMAGQGRLCRLLSDEKEAAQGPFPLPPGEPEARACPARRLLKGVADRSLGD